MEKIFKKEKGFALLTTIFGMALVSIFGLTIVWITISNFKMVRIDSINQSAYYIAEAGVNYIIDKINVEAQRSVNTYETSDEFFKNIGERFTKNKFILEDNFFNKNREQQPRAIITINPLNTAGDTRNYKIRSVGNIGRSRRIVNAVISIDWSEYENNGISNLILYTNKFIFNGSSFNAPGKTIVISGQDEQSINGGSSIKIKNIYFKDLKNGVISGKLYGDENDPGDIYLDGNAVILNSGRIMYGNVHTNGDFTVTGGVTVYGNLYVGGKFEVTGGSHIFGDVYVKDLLQIKGGAIIHGNVYAFKSIDADGGGKIKGNLSVEGDSKLANITIEGSTNIKGDIELGWTPTFNQNVCYTGKIIIPNNYKQEILDKCKHTQDIPNLSIHDYSFVIPNCITSLKQDSWYKEKGYTIKKGYITGKIPQNAKWVVDNYNNTDYQNLDDSEIIIISKGDIILRGGNNFRGALIAPNGTVKYTGGNFKGVIISNEKVSLSGWGPANVQSLDEYFGSLNVPVDIDCESNNSENNNNNENNISVQVTIKSGIREE